MACTKNPKRLLFIKYNGPHDYKIARFGKFILGSNSYIVVFECKYCGCQHKENFITETQLAEMGVPIETIKQHRGIIF